MCLILVLARCCLPLHQKKTKVSPYRVCVHPPSPQTNLGRHAKVFILGDYVMVSTWQLIRGFPWQSGETRSCLTTDIDVSLADFASDYGRNSRGSKKTTRACTPLTKSEEQERLLAVYFCLRGEGSYTQAKRASSYLFKWKQLFSCSWAHALSRGLTS